AVAHHDLVAGAGVDEQVDVRGVAVQVDLVGTRPGLDQSRAGFRPPDGVGVVPRAAVEGQRVPGAVTDRGRVGAAQRVGGQGVGQPRRGRPLVVDDQVTDARGRRHVRRHGQGAPDIVEAVGAVARVDAVEAGTGIHGRGGRGAAYADGVVAA